MRSAKVPLSPSSALQHDELQVGRRPSSTVCHLIPAGNPAPPRPRSPESRDLGDDARPASSSSARRRPGQPAVRLVVVGRQRVDDADPGEGEPLLAAPATAISSVGPSRERVRRRRRGSPAASSAGDVGRRRPGRTRPGRRGVATSTSGSSQSRPREPLRTTVTSTPRRPASAPSAAATSSAPTERAAESRGHVDGGVDRSRPARSGARSGVEPRPASTRPCSRPSTIDRRAERAVAEAEHLVERRPRRRRWSRRSPIPSRSAACVDQAHRRRPPGTPRPGRPGRARAAGGVGAEVAVEGDDPVHLGAGQVEHVGDERRRRAGST